MSTNIKTLIPVVGLIACVIAVAFISVSSSFSNSSIPQTAVSTERAAGCGGSGQAFTTELSNGSAGCGTFLTTQTLVSTEAPSGCPNPAMAFTTESANGGVGCATFLTTQTAVSTEATATCGSNLKFAINETALGAFQCGNQLVRSLRVLSTHESKNTTLTNNPYLQFSVSASTQYWFHADVFVEDAGANAGLKFGLSVPASGTVFTFCNEYLTGIALADDFNACTSNNITSVGTITLGVANAAVLVQLIGFVNVGTSAGTVYVMFASATNLIEADLQGQSVMLYYTPV